MLVFRVKSVFLRRENRNSLLLLLSALPANLFLVLLAAGTEALAGGPFLWSLGAYLLLLLLAFWTGRRGRQGTASLVLAFLGCLSFAPWQVLQARDWRWLILGLLPAVFLAVQTGRIYLGVRFALTSSEGSAVLERRRGSLYGPLTLFCLSLNWLALLCLGCGLYRFHWVSLWGWLAAGALAAPGLALSFLGELSLRRRLGSRFLFLFVPALAGSAICFILGRPTEGILGIMLGLLLVNLHYLTRAEYFSRFSTYFFQHPALLLVTSFMGVILAGTYLLALPWVLNPEQNLELIDAFFLSVSATCVTGLASVDVSKVFSFSGQLVLLGLIQVGGLGIMTLSTFSAILLGRSIGLRQEYFVRDMLGEKRQAEVLPLTIFICLATLCIEACGAAILFPQFMRMGYETDTALWKSVFHSVSAFCNGGLSLQSDSLVCFRHRPGILLTIAGLIIAGGLGFGVLSWLADLLRFRRPRHNFYVSVVLAGTLVLTVVGTLGFLAWDSARGLQEFDLPEKVTNAFFCSATARTAGFSTFDLNDMSRSGRLLTMALMFIGGAPGSTAGGVKLTTLVVFLGLLLAVMRGRDEVTWGRHSFHYQTVFRAMVVFMLYLAALLVGFVLLLTFEDAGYEEILFESVSAIGTTGLSMGLTERLSVFGRLTVASMMFVGRLGPLTLLLLLPGRRHFAVEYPKARLMVG